MQIQKVARSLKFRIEEKEKLYYPISENKGTDQLRSYCEADLRLCFRTGKIGFSHNAAHNYGKICETMMLLMMTLS